MRKWSFKYIKSAISITSAVEKCPRKKTVCVSGRLYRLLFRRLGAYACLRWPAVSFYQRNWLRISEEEHHIHHQNRKSCPLLNKIDRVFRSPSFFTSNIQSEVCAYCARGSRHFRRCAVNFAHFASKTDV